MPVLAVGLGIVLAAAWSSVLLDEPTERSSVWVQAFLLDYLRCALVSARISYLAPCGPGQRDASLTCHEILLPNTISFSDNTLSMRCLDAADVTTKDLAVQNPWRDDPPCTGRRRCTALVRAWQAICCAAMQWKQDSFLRQGDNSDDCPDLCRPAVTLV